MEKTCAISRVHSIAKGRMYGFLLVFVLKWSSLVRACDIYFYQNGNDCAGAVSLVCFNVDVDNDPCCLADPGWNAGAAQIVTDDNQCIQSAVFQDGRCTTYNNGGSQGDACYLSASPLSGASVWNTCRRRRSLLGHELRSKPIVDGMKPNAVAFQEQDAKGRWILASSNATELISQIQKIDDVEKVNWFKSQGATYKEL